MNGYKVLKTVSDDATYGFDVIIGIFTDEDAANYVAESLTEKTGTRYFVEPVDIISCGIMSMSFLDKFVGEVIKNEQT